MPNANGEDAPTGRTSIHEDTNNDRVYDKTSALSAILLQV
jgi:hypothetical protein